MSEKEVFIQNVSDEEMEAVAGGHDDCGTGQTVNCINEFYRDIYYHGFPNCAATVEEGSWCGSNDACERMSVNYFDMVDCHKVYR